MLEIRRREVGLAWPGAVPSPGDVALFRVMKPMDRELLMVSGAPESTERDPRLAVAVDELRRAHEAADPKDHAFVLDRLAALGRRLNGRGLK